MVIQTLKIRQNSKILRILTAGEKGKARISRPIKSAGMALIKNVLREPYFSLEVVEPYAHG